MSKLCISEEEAKKTVEWYKEQYKNKKSPYDSPDFRKSNDNKFWVVYNKLKSIYVENAMFFLMKENIPPLWESSDNIEGGCWSFKIYKKKYKRLIFFPLQQRCRF